MYNVIILFILWIKESFSLFCGQKKQPLLHELSSSIKHRHIRYNRIVFYHHLENIYVTEIFQAYKSLVTFQVTIYVYPKEKPTLCVVSFKERKSLYVLALVLSFSSRKKMKNIEEKNHLWNDMYNRKNSHIKWYMFIVLRRRTWGKNCWKKICVWFSLFMDFSLCWMY